MKAGAVYNNSKQRYDFFEIPALRELFSFVKWFFYRLVAAHWPALTRVSTTSRLTVSSEKLQIDLRFLPKSFKGEEFTPDYDELRMRWEQLSERTQIIGDEEAHLFLSVYD